MNNYTKTAAVLLLTVVITAGCAFLVGPQIMIIVPAAFVAGIIFAFRRSFLSLVFFGYPFTFGLLSAGIGRSEISGYEHTLAFAISIGIGLVGVGLIAVGLWKALPDRTNTKQ